MAYESSVMIHSRTERHISKKIWKRLDENLSIFNTHIDMGGCKKCVWVVGRMGSCPAQGSKSSSELSHGPAPSSWSSSRSCWWCWWWLYQPEDHPGQKSTWGFFWIYKIVSFCCFTQHMTFKSVGEPDQRRAHYKAAAKKKEQYCSPLYSTQCTQQRERERERAQKRRAACRKSLSTHRCTEEAGGCREKWYLDVNLLNSIIIIIISINVIIVIIVIVNHHLHRAPLMWCQTEIWRPL